MHIFDIAADNFRRRLNTVKQGFDPKNRSFLSSEKGKRLVEELSLVASAATLIIVPLSLLEHWYEQITRHMNLKYFTDHPEGRGVVWIDGLGDIVDVRSPLPKLEIGRSIQISADALAQYLIVVTTFERCSSEFANLNNPGSAVKISCASANTDPDRQFGNRSQMGLTAWSAR